MSAFGGGPLEGSEVVRFVFTDEGGISRYEPFVVMAGVFVHGDDQLVPLEEALEELVRKHIPEENQRGFVFHATDIWSGTGKIFKDRDKWPLQKRLDILRDLAGLPKKLDIPIIYDAVERSAIDLKKEGREPTAHEVSVGAHSIIFMSCILRIEEIMRLAWPREIAQIVAEDNDQVRALVQGSHEVFRDPSKAEGRLVANKILPLKKIRGAVHFATKTESSPLQVADICAFLIRGHLAKHPQNAPLYEIIKPMMLILPKGETSPGTKFTLSPYR